VLILLPPSEGKSRPTTGPPLDLATLTMPELTVARLEVLVPLEHLCAGDSVQAAHALGLPPSVADDVARNSTLRSAPSGSATSHHGPAGGSSSGSWCPPGCGASSG
jgi:hypothetical protein